VPLDPAGKKGNHCQPAVYSCNRKEECKDSVRHHRDLLEHRAHCQEQSTYTVFKIGLVIHSSRPTVPSSSYQSCTHTSASFTSTNSTSKTIPESPFHAWGAF
jgi:hypothetical protein